MCVSEWVCVGCIDLLVGAPHFFFLNDAIMNLNWAMKFECEGQKDHAEK